MLIFNNSKVKKSQSFSSFLKTEALFYLLLIVIQALFWCLISFVVDKKISIFFISSVTGSAVFLFPTFVYFALGYKRKDSQLTAGIVIFDAIKSLFFKYLLFILLAFLCFKFLEIDGIVFFVSLIFSAIFCYIKRFFAI
ncbi:hypothetical protein [uncultured Succinatimonas sp.]|uniref:hypothetical protein n=1 Tax=uncultured Succinatimonas sp. TaxID=1262973 RepID=UPI0025D9F0FF|nr:hypothetical protein [uncultured Succinatimonas sp.]